MSRRLRLWMWALGGALLLLVVVGVALLLVARAYAPTLTRERIERALADALRRPARVERVELQPWLARLVVENIQVAAGPGWESGTLLTVRRATVRVGISSLWRREIVLSRIAFDDVDVQYVATGGDEPARLPLAIPERIDAGPVTLVVAGVTVGGGRVRYTDARAGRTVELEGLTATALPAGGGLDVTAGAAKLRLQAGAFDDTVTAVRVTGRLRGEDLSLNDVRLTWRGEEIRAFGSVRALGGTPVLALDARGKIPLSAAGELAGAGITVSGVAAFDGSVAGPVEAPVVKARATVPELTAGALTARRVTADLEWRDGTLRLSDAGAQALEGDIKGALVLVPARPREGRATVQAAGISLAALERALGRPLGARGRITGRGELRGDLRRPLDGAGTFTLESSDLTLPDPLARLGAGTAAAEVKLAGGVVDVVQGRGQWPGARVTDVSGQLGADGPSRLRATVSGDAGRLARAWGEDRLAGEATVTVELSGRWSDLVAAGRARAASLGVAGVGLSAVDIPYRVADRTLTFTDAAATLGQSRVTGSGALTWTGTGPIEVAAVRQRLRIQADVATTGARLEDLDAWIPAEWRGTGRFSLTARLEGTLAAWRGTGTVAATGLTVRGEPIEELNTRFSVTSAGVEVGGFRGRMRGAPVEGEGAWLTSGDARLSARFGPASLARLPGVPEALELSGIASGRVQVERRGGRLSGTAAVATEDAAAFGVALGRGSIDARVADDALSATAAFPQARLSVTAQGLLAAGQTIAVGVQFAELSLAPVLARAAPPAGLEIRGAVSGSADLAVPFSDPKAARGTLRLDAARAVVNGEEWRNREPVLLERRAGATRLERVRLASASGAVDVTGVVEDAGRLDLSGQGAFPLAALAAFAPAITDAAGILEVAARVRGTFAAPDLNGEGSIRDGRVVTRQLPQLPLSNLRARFAATQDRIRISEAVGTLPGGEVRARGDVLVGGGAPRLVLDVSAQVPLTVVPSVRPEIAEASGMLTFAGKVGGTATAPEIRGNGTISDGRVVARDVPMPVTGLSVRFTLAPDRLRVAEAAATVEGGAVRASGDIVFGQPPQLDVKIVGKLPLAVLAARRPEIREAAGFLDVDARVTGTTEAPQLAGGGSVAGARIALRDYAESLRDVRARFTASPAGIRLVSSTAAFAGGEVSVTGDLALERWQPGSYRFGIQARRVSLAPVDGLQTSWDADLELVGFAKRSLLRGEARLLRGAYTSDLPLLRLLLQQRGGARGGDGPGLPLEVRVNLGDNFTLRTAPARLRAGGIVTLQGTAAAPILFGAIEISEGQLVFRKNRFEITSGSAQFTDPRRVDPFLDIHARTHVKTYDQTYDVFLTVNGRSDDLEVRLSSVPPLSQEDVVSLIAFGSTRAQLAKSGGVGVAGQMAGFILQDFFGVGVGDGTVPIDVLDVQTAESGARSVRVGKRVNERATVLYSQGLQNKDDRRLRVEYELIGPLVVAGEQDFRGGYGGDILLRLRFR